MKYHIELTRDAQLDLLAITDFYQQTAGDAVAKKILLTIQSALASLVEIPKRSHKPHELYSLQATTELEIVVDRYRIIYLFRNDIVYVIAIFDGRQDVKSHLAKRRSRLYQHL